MGKRRKRTAIKWHDLVEHSQAVDLDRATFSPEARQVGATLYKAVHRVQWEESIEWTVMRDALYLTLVKASAASKQEAN